MARLVCSELDSSEFAVTELRCNEICSNLIRFVTARSGGAQRDEVTRIGVRMHPSMMRHAHEVGPSGKAGMIRVGKRVGSSNPSYPGYTTIVVMMKSHSKWWSLGPYYSTVEDCIVENAWQFSKVYAELSASTQHYSPYDRTVIWNWPAETHLIDGDISPEYWRWRDAGVTNKYAVRYPVGKKQRHMVEFSLLIGQDGSVERLGYVEARKRLYLPWYVKSVRHLPQFRELRDRVRAGEKILIVEIDGPHQESLDYYIDRYGVDRTFIEQGSMQATAANLNVMLNDGKHAFGHGYCLAAALLGIHRDLH